jgi:hypothetical protein
MSPPQRTAPVRTQRARVRLWPLLLAPPVGLAAGLIYERSRPLQSTVPGLDLALFGAYGMAAGCAVMMGGGMAVLAYRLARQRFTIRALLLAIAAAAVLLAVLRALWP